jgi:DNA-binding MarR family transcriptional regulator
LSQEIKKKNINKAREELLQKLVEQMFRVMKQIHHEVTLRGTSLRMPHVRLLFAIAGNSNGGISVKDLAEKTGVTPGAITQFVDALVEKGLVERVEDPEDRRIVRLTATEAAKNQMEDLQREFVASAITIFNPVTDDEIKQLTGLLAKVSSAGPHTHSRK